MSESICWAGPVGDRGGYGNVARNYVRGLSRTGAPPALVNTQPLDPDIGLRDLALLDALAPKDTADADLFVAHTEPGSLAELVESLRDRNRPVAACTIAETDRLSPEWVAGCNAADEIWVPTTFNLLTFAASGVDPHKLRLVPYGMDAEAWEPEGRVDASVAPDDHFVFLYTFAFDWRKGFDLLLTSYLEEFTRADPVTLVLKVYERPGAEQSIRTRLAASVLDRVDLFRDDLPRVVVVDEALERDDLAALHRRADLYVSTDRANGWGMPCMEHMAMGGAAACIDWSGSTEFMHAGNALLIPPRVPLVPVDERLQRERPAYAGQRWADVAEADVRGVLRAAAGGDVDLAGLGAAARAEILERWSLEDSAAWITGRDAEAYRSPAGLAERLRPLVGLRPGGAVDDCRPRLLAVDLEEAWDIDLDVTLTAYAEAFAADAPVTLAFVGDPAADGPRVESALARTGIDPDAVADLVLVQVDLGDVLADPRLAGLVGPGRWPADLTTACFPEVDALREAADRPAPAALAVTAPAPAA